MPVTKRQYAGRDGHFSAISNNNDDTYDAEQSDFDTDLEDEMDSETRTTADKSVAAYKKACVQAGVLPISYVIRHLQDSTLVLRHRGLTPKDTQALSVPLLMNTTVTYLDLQANHIEADGIVHVAAIVNDNLFITRLDLSHNFLKKEGAEYLCKILKHNRIITELNLSDNGFDDNAGPIFQELLKVNTTLRCLNLSSNLFSQDGAICIGLGLTQNNCLDELDLSWNHIRLGGAEGFAKGLKKNQHLKKLNLAMNGFSDVGMTALVSALQANSSLLELDISNNRISPDGCRHLSKLLQHNETLNTLKIGLNPIYFDGADLLLAAILTNRKSRVSFLDLTGVLVTKDFMNAANACSCRRSFKVIVGHVTKRTDFKGGPEQWRCLNPLEVLLVFMTEKNLRLFDLFKELDRDHNMTVSAEEFIHVLHSINTPMSKGQMDKLIKMLDKDGNKLIDLREIFNINKEFRSIRKKATQAVYEKRAHPNEISE